VREKNPRIHVLVHVPCFQSVLRGEICKNFTWMKNMQFTHPIAFQSSLHDNSTTWADAGPLKVKYLVNAGKCERLLKETPFNKLKVS